MPLTIAAHIFNNEPNDTQWKHSAMDIPQNPLFEAIVIPLQIGMATPLPSMLTVIIHSSQVLVVFLLQTKTNLGGRSTEI